MAALIPFAFAAMGAFALGIIFAELRALPMRRAKIRAQLEQIKARRIRVTIRTIGKVE